MRTILIALIVAVASVMQAHSGEAGAKVIKIANKAEIFRAGEWNVASVGDTIGNGEAVRTADSGEVEVEAADGKISLNGKANTVIEYNGIVDADVVPWKSASLGAATEIGANASQQFSCPVGSVEIRVKTGEPLRVVTPLLTAAVRGTQFAMQVAADGSSALQLRQGAVDGYDRTGTVRRIAPGEDMALASSAFVNYLGGKGVELAPGQDWRSLPTTVLEAVDNATFSGLFSQVYYNPAVGQMVKSRPGQGGVDEAKVAKAAYIGTATLEDILDSPDANPMTMDWFDDLAASPMNTLENNYLNTVYYPDMASVPNDDRITNQFTEIAAGNGTGEIALGNGTGSSLIDGGLPAGDVYDTVDNNANEPSAPIIPGTPGSGGVTPPLPPISNPMAIVKGTLSPGASPTVNGSFGFNLDLNSGSITNGRLSGSGNNGTVYMNFGLNGGTGTYNSGTQTFTVGNFQYGQVSGNSPDANSWINGQAPSGLNQVGNPVTGTFNVHNTGTGANLGGNINGSRVN